MEARRREGIHVVRLDRGEAVIASLQAYVGERGILGGSIVGIGAVEEAEIGIYPPAERRYVKRTFRSARELVSLTGTISRLDGRPFVHAHVVLSDEDFRAIGGHLFEARVAVTGEFVIHEAPIASSRMMDDATGLKLMRFEAGS